MPEDNKLLIGNVNFKGFKSIDQLSVELKPGLNILIGKNGSGKSNFLEMLEQVVQSLFGSNYATSFKSASINFYVPDVDTFDYHIGRRSKNNVASEGGLPEDVYFQTLAFNKEIIYDSREDDHGTVFNYHGRKIRVGRYPHTVFQRLGFGYFRPKYIRYQLPVNLDGIESPGSIDISLFEDEFALDWAHNVNGALLMDAFFDFETSITEQFYQQSQNLEEEEQSSFFKEFIKRFDADHLLSNISINSDVKSNLALFSPIKDVRLNENIVLVRDEHIINYENIRLEFYVNEQWLPWSHLSDGTKRLFYIISEVALASRGIILIEEPELGIHPHQFQLLMTFLKEQSVYKQILISTHSPKALDILDPEELAKIMIANYSPKVGTQINRMTAAQEEKARKYMDDMFLSDYWLLSDLEE
jgi:predicted ATPase